MYYLQYILLINSKIHAINIQFEITIITRDNILDNKNSCCILIGTLSLIFKKKKNKRP